MSMQPVHLRFTGSAASPGLRLLGQAGGRGTKAIAALLLIAAAGACAIGAWRLGETRRDLAAAGQALDAARRNAGSPSAQRPRPPATMRSELSLQQRQAWAQLVRQLNTPWSGLLDALESATPDDVALVSIEPNARQGNIRVQAEARTLEALLAYAARLAGSPAFGGVTLVKHETNEQDVNKPLRLSLQVQLRPSAQGRAPTLPGGPP